MKLVNKYTNILLGYVFHGLKTVGDYQYVLLINMEGEVIIMQIKTDQSVAKYKAKPTATTIDNFWSAPDTHTYDYIHMLNDEN